MPRARLCQERLGALQGVPGLGHQPLHDLPGRDDVLHQPRALACKGQQLVDPPLLQGGQHLSRRRSASRLASSRRCCQVSMNGVRRARMTVPYPRLPGTGLISFQTSTLTASCASASTIRCFHPSGMGASTEARNRVPTLTPTAPRTKAAARRPSAMPPAATTGRGWTASTTCGRRVNVAIVPP